jgi:4-hydroxy-tetrahydrodipicolinate synthase
MVDRLSGVIPPMITPLTADEEVDRSAVRRQVDFMIEGGVDGLFLLGSIGEGPFLRARVRQELVEAAVEAAAGRVPVIAGIIETGTTRVIEEMRGLSGRGLAAYVAAAPYYFGGFNDQELSGHFQRVADAADLTVLLYNIPQNTHVPMKAPLVLKLAEHANVAGIKDSSGDWAEVHHILRERPAGFTVLQGNQSLCAVSLLAGAEGLVPGHANVWPQLLRDLMAAGRRGDMEAALSCQAQLDKLVRLRGRASTHTFKIVTKYLGLTEDHVSAPLQKLGPEEASRFIDASIAGGLPLPARASG